MSKKYKSLMYYAIPFTNDGCCIHGSDGFVAMLDGEGNPLGFAQSHGCVRVPMSVAKELYQKVRVGTPVQVVGETEEAHKALFSIIKDMYEDTDSGIRMKVAGPNPSPADVQKAREMWLAGRLFSTPRGETDVRKRWVGYPFLPKESRMNAFDFEKAILTAEEKAQGKHLTFRKFDLVK